MIESPEKALRAAQAQLAAIYEQSTVGIAASDREGRFLMTNARFAAMAGRSSDELLKLTIEDVTHPDDLGGNMEMFDRVYDTGEPFTLEKRYLHPDGNIVWVRVHISLVGDEPPYTLGLAEDITEQKEAHERIKRQWRLFDSALSNTPDSTYIFDSEGRCIYANQHLLSLWKKSLSEAAGKNFYELGYPKELADRVHRQIRQIVDTGEPVRDETPLDVFTPGTHYYEYIFVPVFGETGMVEAIAGSTRDVTEHHATIAALQRGNREAEEARRALARTLDSITDGFFTVDRDWNFTYMNPEGEKILGRTAGELVGKNLWAAYPEAAGSSFERNYLLAIAEDRMVEFEEFYPPLDAWLEVRVHPSPGSLSIYFRNISERKRAQDALTKQAEELKRTNADLEQFAWSASHDLQEPLRMISLFTELLRVKYSDKMDAQANSYIARAVQGANRMQALIRDLLAYTRATGSEKPVSPVKLDHILDRVIKNLDRSLTEAGANVQRTPLPTLRVQEVHMEQIFQNLISNAIKYRGPHPPVIRIVAERQATAWLISVADNGIGIDPQYAEQIFGIFKRLHNHEEYEGTGIGLAICQKIVERYHGRIWVESALDRGAKFFFTIPDSDLPTGH